MEMHAKTIPTIENQSLLKVRASWLKGRCRQHCEYSVEKGVEKSLPVLFAAPDHTKTDIAGRQLNSGMAVVVARK